MCARLTVLCGCWVLFTAPSSLAAEADWNLERDRDGVQVYTRDVEGSKFKAVRATMRMTIPLGDLVALVRDAPACRDWAAHCKSAEIIEAVSETELYVYTLNNMPWPVSDRDAVAHIEWMQNSDDLSVRMSATLVPERLPANAGVVRIPYGETAWEFTPVGDGSVEIVSLAHLDPGGATPAWLANRLLVDAPFDTMVGMRDLVMSGRYADSSFEFLTEP